MTRTNLLVSTAVVLLCGGILVLFTDIEMAAVRWVNCSLDARAAKLDPRCR
ncbi:hypothetical protein KQ302_09175 [Synechococcus sp. CS-602]|uniref:hypothetical protein n=1 Tax=Synechococcaceae TaxID=1890426 RepID=UPI000A7FDC57|nr:MULTISPECIES: hypothetical protein [Synechococcaceae]MCT4363445.1 hypothetical protein [Candidatus Regnicoccus frigidus MAG-AL1]MCT0203257.1 hypothetical protein [Synechococcus sp. CS-603]MCT0205263.1 hypothetical protein [Synechococcus sp. CS-602]MCT0246757.1 hypothetical protein [Synechococcus sp. CS-601]MCT4367940.1 hypothetical protein [Candidatus Regnicoccus frigidus MAG-AL2]